MLFHNLLFRFFANQNHLTPPPVNDGEMAHGGRDWSNVATRVNDSKPLALAENVPSALQTWIGKRNYAELFNETFGTPEVSPSRIALAIAAYERTLFSDQTPLDLANAGITPLTQQELNGRNVFNNTQCNTCHAGNLLTDNTFRNIGLRPAAEDTGRFQVTANNNNVGEFGVPSLRNVELRSSFMHNGRFSTLEEVIEFYNRGGDFPNQPNFQGNLIRPRNLSNQQKADLAAFLRRPLTDNRVRNELPPFDRPHLYTESSRVPQIIGTGVAGSGGFVPQPTAIEPPFVGNPSFTVAVSNALGNAQAVLVINSTDPETISIPASGSLVRQTITLQGNGSGGGFGSISISIPDNLSLAGQTFFGRWYITDASAPNGFSVTPAFRFTVFGESSSDINRAAHVDFDGDGKADIAIFRAGVWYLQTSSKGISFQQFGLAGDIPQIGDYDGDGKSDLAIFRPSKGEWWINRSSLGIIALTFGNSNDKPIAADFTGDGKTDVAFWRPADGFWYVLRSEDFTYYGFPFGISTDIPAPGDYDGDGRTDAAVYRAGVWYLNRSTSGLLIMSYGNFDDYPAPAAYVP